MSDSYRSHKDVAEKLEHQLQSVVSAQDQRDLQQHPIVIHEVELSEEDISLIYQKWFSQLKQYYARLPPVRAMIDRPKLEYMELAVIDRGQRILKNKMQISDFLQATMQGIDAVHSKSGSIKYEEILKFEDDKPSTGRRIVISGAPGCGKSTLSRHLCKDLSSKKLPNNYQMVVLVELRELIFRMKQDEELDLKHFFVKYASKSVNNYNVCDALDQSHGKNAMFILDGYDELEESLRSCWFLKRILSTHDPTLYLSECDVVITTRPVTCKKLFTLVTNPHRHVEILGFNRVHIEEYIDIYFKGYNQSVVKKLKDRLHQLPHVCGMCRIPIVLEIVCKVHYLRGDCGIPETQTGIYQEYIIAELINSKEGQKILIKDLLTVSEVDFPGFYELCQKAFECCSTEQRLLLTEHDVINLIQYEKRGSIYGLLFVEIVESLREGGNIRLYHYLHKSIQEMLAAVHIGTLPDSEHASLWEKHLGHVEMGEIWKYYAGITSLKKIDTRTLQEMCQKKMREEDHKMLLIISLFEADNSDVAAEVLPEIFPNGLISIAASSSYEVTALNYCIKHHPTVKGMEFTGPRPFVKFGEPLRDMMRSLHASSSVDSVSFSQLHQEDWKLFSETLPPNSSITCARLGHVPVYIVSDVLLKCDLKKLILDGMINVTNRSSASSAGSLDNDLLCRKAAALDWLEFIVTSASKLTENSSIERLLSSITKELMNTTSALEITTEDPCNKEDSDAKWKTVKLSLPKRITDQNKINILKAMMSIVKVLMKELSSCQNVQHLIFIADYKYFIGGSNEYDESWMSSLKLLLVSRLTCQLTLHLSPAEWAAILCGVGGAEDLEELNVSMTFTNDNTPMDEKELCEAWSQCKCKTVKMTMIDHPIGWTELKRSIVRTLLKGISLCQNVQHLMIDCFENCSPEYDESWMSSLKLLLVPRLTSQLTLSLSPAEWAAILCGVGGAEDLEELNVSMTFTAGNTPVDEKYLCEAWSQCKCKTVKMEIDYPFSKTPQGASLLTGVLGGVAQNKTSVEFKLKFWDSDDQSYYMERIPEDIPTHFTRDDLTLTLNPLNSRCPTGGVSSGESPQTPGSNPTEEPSNKRRHIEQPPLVGVTESTSSSPSQQVDHASRNVHSTQSDSSRSSPMSQRASLPQSPISSVVDPSSLVTVPMETSRPDISPSSTHSHRSTRHTKDSPQPPHTLWRTHPLALQYETGQTVSLSSSATSQGIPQQMDTSPMVHSTQSDSSRSSPMSQRAPLPQSPISSVVDPLSLVTVPMETSRPDMSPSSTHSHTSAHRTRDSPQPSCTLRRTHPIDPQYGDLTKDEVVLCDLCWVPFGVLSEPFGWDGSTINIDTNSPVVKGETFVNQTIIEIPVNTIDQNAKAEIHYGIVADGPFKLPTGYKLGSMVVYLVSGGAKLKKSLILHLAHWLSSMPNTKKLIKCVWAPHGLQTVKKEYSFSFLNEEKYRITQTAAEIHVDGVNTLFAIAYKAGVKTRYQYQVFDEETSEISQHTKDVRIYITYFCHTWKKIVDKYCAQPTWHQRPVSYMRPISIIGNELKATVSPASKRDWTITAPCGYESIALESFHFTNKDNVGSLPLKDAIEHHYYPPVIHYSVIQNHPKGCEPRKSCAYIKLTSTEPAVNIPVDVVDYEPVCNRQNVVDDDYRSNTWSNAGGSGFDCRKFMENYEDRFLQCVDSHTISNMLLVKGIIPSNLSHQLQNVDSTTGTQLVFLHLRSHADRDSLLKLCDVMIIMEGYPNMSSLGRDMKRDLEQPVNSSTSQSHTVSIQDHQDGVHQDCQDSVQQDRQDSVHQDRQDSVHRDH